jgi:hypothetical protein
MLLSGIRAPYLKPVAQLTDTFLDWYRNLHNARRRLSYDLQVLEGIHGFQVLV